MLEIEIGIVDGGWVEFWSIIPVVWFIETIYTKSLLKKHSCFDWICRILDWILLAYAVNLLIQWWQLLSPQ